jgi:alpha-glucosidase
LRVYAGENCHGSLYQDDGHSFAFQRGELLRVNYSCQASPASISITSATEKNSFQPWWNTAEITVYGANTEPKELRLGDRPTHEWRYDAAGHSVVFTVPNAAQNWTAQLMF